MKCLRFNFSEGKQVKPAPSCTFSVTENQILTKQANKIGLSSAYLKDVLPDQRPASYTPGLPLSCLNSLIMSPSTALLRNPPPILQVSTASINAKYLKLVV